MSYGGSKSALRPEDENAAPRLEPKFSRKLSRRPPLLDLSTAGGPSVPMGNRKRTPGSLQAEQETASSSSWAALSRRGKGRANREDAFAAHPSFLCVESDGEPLSLFCIFDGHGGDRASKYARVRLPLLFEKYISEENGDELIPALERAFVSVHNELVQLLNRGYESTTSGTPDASDAAGLLRTWTAVPEKNKDNSSAYDGGGETGGYCGTTATAVLLGRGELTIVHAGDSRAVGALSDGMTMRLCRDHRPSDPEEAERVSARGGLVLRVGGAERVNGVLAVSRSLGHAGELGELVIPNPETTCHMLDDLGLLIVASDGLWDSISDEDAINIATKAVSTNGPSAATKALCEAACSAGSTDDITVMVVVLDSFGGAKLETIAEEDVNDEKNEGANDELIDREDAREPKFVNGSLSTSSSTVSGTPRHGAHKMMW